ncbi:MAG: hypothetical protein SF339_01535 [Blastocatellia bacterium]|nr:hypothetical protein [Blastocatellia bacterium]
MPVVGSFFGGPVGFSVLTDNRQPTTDNRQPTTDNRQPTTDNRQPCHFHPGFVFR